MEHAKNAFNGVVDFTRNSAGRTVIGGAAAIVVGAAPEYLKTVAQLIIADPALPISTGQYFLHGAIPVLTVRAVDQLANFALGKIKALDGKDVIKKVIRYAVDVTALVGSAAVMGAALGTNIVVSIALAVVAYVGQFVFSSLFTPKGAAGAASADLTALTDRVTANETALNGLNLEDRFAAVNSTLAGKKDTADVKKQKAKEAKEAKRSDKTDGVVKSGSEESLEDVEPTKKDQLTSAKRASRKGKKADPTDQKTAVLNGFELFLADDVTARFYTKEKGNKIDEKKEPFEEFLTELNKLVREFKTAFEAEGDTTFEDKALRVDCSKFMGDLVKLVNDDIAKDGESTKKAHKVRTSELSAVLDAAKALSSKLFDDSDSSSEGESGSAKEEKVEEAKKD